MDPRRGSRDLRQARGAQWRRLIWLNEVALNKTPAIDIYFDLEDASGFTPTPPVEVVDALATTHWGTKLMSVRDPDGRIVRLQAT